jgi:glycerophosphoryl diester phosphodiesterase
MRRSGVVISLFLLVGLLLSGAAPANGSEPHPVIYAHRGGAGYAPENTLGAFRKTWDLFGSRGVWLEMDTQSTKDGVLVVMHDDTVDRTTNCKGAVNALTLQQLRQCDAAAKYQGWGQAERIPTLAEVLTEGKANGWKLMVEIKNIPLEANFNLTGDKVAKQLVALVYATKFPIDHLLVQSFFPASLDNMRRLEPRIKRVFLTASKLPSLPVGVPALGNGAYSTLTNYQISAPDIASLGMNKQYIAIAHRLGRQVVPWTIDDAKTLYNLRAWQADGVITNRPDVAFAAYG